MIVPLGHFWEYEDVFPKLEVRIHWESTLVLVPRSPWRPRSLAPAPSAADARVPLKLACIRGDPVSPHGAQLGLRPHWCARESPSLLLLTAWHLADVLCRRNAEHFPFHYVRSSGLGLALPQESGGHSWSRAGPRRGAGSKARTDEASASHGVREGALHDARWEEVGHARSLPAARISALSLRPWPVNSPTVLAAQRRDPREEEVISAAVGPGSGWLEVNTTFGILLEKMKLPIEN